MNYDRTIVCLCGFEVLMLLGISSYDDDCLVWDCMIIGIQINALISGCPFLLWVSGGGGLEVWV